MPHTAFTKKLVLDLPTTCVPIWITANSKMPIQNPERWVRQRYLYLLDGYFRNQKLRVSCDHY